MFRRNDFHNSSGREGLANAFVREATVLDIPIEVNANVDKRNHKVNLSWSYKYDGRRDHYGVIYRSLNDGEYVDIANFRRGETSFTDDNVKVGDRASYYIVLYLGNGQRSTPSTSVSAKL